MRYEQDVGSVPIRKLVLIVFLGAFAMGNAKFSIIQLLPLIEADLHASEPEALQVVVSYFWGALLGAPLIAVCCRNWNKQLILTLLSLWCFVGNVLSSLAWHIDVLHALRFFSGMPHGAFLALATLLVAEYAPPAKRGWYVGLVLSGLAAAILVTVPFNTWLGRSYGWEVTLRFVALADLLIVLLIHDLLPKVAQPVGKLSWRAQCEAFRHAYVWVYSALGVCLLTAMICVWSYSFILLQEHSQLPAQMQMVLLLCLGVGFWLGQMAGGYLADRHWHRYMGVMAVAAMLILVALWLVLSDYRLVLPLMVGIGGVCAISVLVQVRLLDVPAASLYLVFAVFNSLIQLCNFLGAKLANSILNAAVSDLWVIGAALILAGISLLLWLWSFRVDKSIAHGKTMSVM